MCGIGGIFVGEQSIDLHKIEQLWSAIADRGTHASGFSFRWKNADMDIVWKRPISSRKAVSKGVFSSKVGGSLSYALLHTRYTTQGSTANNGNNHPVVSHDMIVTHNGVISNDREIFNQLESTRIHEVDTECINASLRIESPSWLIENVRGSMSIAWVDITQNQHEVNLLTNGRNPLVIGRTTQGHVVWASNLYHLEDSFELDSHFNAQPNKIYTISQGIEEPVITSRFISNERPQATVLRRNSHVASYGSYVPKDFKSSKTTKPTKTKTKARKGTSKASKQTTLIEAGFAYDYDLNCWRKATKKDYENCYELKN